MRSTIIPAQIMSVEDKITSLLNLKQIIILVSDLILVALIFLSLPPFAKFSILKLILALLISVLIIPLAFKIKGVLLIEYLSLILAYKSRSRVYVLSKNDRLEKENYYQEKSNSSKKVEKLNKSIITDYGFSFSYGKKGEVYLEFLK